MCYQALAWGALPRSCSPDIGPGEGNNDVSVYSNSAVSCKKVCFYTLYLRLALPWSPPSIYVYKLACRGHGLVLALLIPVVRLRELDEGAARV